MWGKSGGGVWNKCSSLCDDIFYVCVYCLYNTFTNIYIPLNSKY